ncbi:MAG: hypothetical protein AVDCRST_MAG15-2670 [uncultured Rubellimicrobium sp.]|uniref:Uncharacterized protein n=1 Tax=uncultured Rubellimicrobium sp. TaxID=543078 RepID=A0A6J4Q519_9RHOB|nr:MAG: hypothetical protein AVDCRST_MAG15-2670 [uncultured Rubellimicrobium sp.]
MTRSLPALVAALAVGLLPLPAFAEQGDRGRDRGESCPPGLDERDPACIPPGQVGRQERRNRNAEDRALRFLNELARDRDEDRDRAEDNDAEEALAIVGALVGLALLERASRDDEPEMGEPAPVAVAPWTPPEIPARPDSLAFAEEPDMPFIEAAPPVVLAEPASPAVEAAPIEVAPVEVAPVEAAPAVRIPPPPPAAAGAPTSDEISEVFERAESSGATGF